MRKKSIKPTGLLNVFLCRFPRNPVLRARWINQMNDESFEPTAQSVLCSLHFIKEFFVTDANGVQYLKQDAIPTEFEYECYTVKMFF